MTFFRVIYNFKNLIALILVFCGKTINYAWPLKGQLKNHKMYFRRPEDIQYIKGDYEHETHQIMKEVIKPGSICVDLGAHIGYTTMYMAKITGSEGHVYSFEAIPQNALMLKRNIFLNNYQKTVTIENIAVDSKKKAWINLYTGPTSFQASTIDKNRPLEARVPAISIDEYFKNQKVDFIKIDVEGAELKVLRGSQKILSSQKPVLIIEIHGNFSKIINQLNKHNYRSFIYNKRFSRDRHQDIIHMVAVKKDNKAQIKVFRRYDN